MVRSKILFGGPACVVVFAMGVSVEPNLSRWSDESGIFTSAKGQMPLEGCEEFQIHQATNDATYYKCTNVKYYRQTGADYIEVDEQGRFISDQSKDEAEPGTGDASVAPSSEPAAEPEFKVTPQ